MWNKRKEEEYPPKSGSMPSTPANPIKDSAPMSTAPAASHFSTDMRGPAVIGKSVMIKGQIFSREDLTIDGEIDGSVELQEHRLTVGPHGKLQAGVKAREIIVLGAIHGNVEASDKIDIRKDAKLVGDIKTARYFKGSIDIVRPEISKPAAPVAPVAPKPAATAASSSASAAAASVPVGPLSGELKR